MSTDPLTEAELARVIELDAKAMNDHNPDAAETIRRIRELKLGASFAGTSAVETDFLVRAGSLAGELCNIAEAQSARIAELERLHLEAIDEQAAQANIMRELERRVQELTEENARASEVSRHAADASAIRESELSQLRATLAQERDEATDYAANLAGIDADRDRLTEENESLRAQLASEADRWKPIETAPKDGTRLLLFPNYDGEVGIGWWNSDDNDFGDFEHSWQPTHWQLPQPPQ